MRVNVLHGFKRLNCWTFMHYSFNQDKREINENESLLQKMTSQINSSSETRDLMRWRKKWLTEKHNRAYKWCVRLHLTKLVPIVLLLLWSGGVIGKFARYSRIYEFTCSLHYYFKKKLSRFDKYVIISLYWPCWSLNEPLEKYVMMYIHAYLVCIHIAYVCTHFVIS